MISKIKHDTLGEFEKDKRDMEKEMDNRFTHQDRTIKNISHFITTF
jgi:regulator of sigma D